MSYRVDIPTLSANEVYTLTFEYEGTETIQLIVGDLTLETTDRRVVFTTTSPVDYIESNVNLINLNLYEGYYESDDFGGEYTQESYIEGRSLVNYKRRVDYGTLINNANIQETFTDDDYINYKQLGTGATGRGFRGNRFAKNIDQSKNYTIILRVRKNTFPADVFVPFTLCHKDCGVKFDETVKGDYWGVSYNISGRQTGVWKAVVIGSRYNVSASDRYWGSIYSFFVDENSEVTDLTQRTDIVGCEIEYAIEVLQGDYFDIDTGIDEHFESIGCVKSPKIVSQTEHQNVVITDIFKLSSESSSGATFDKETRTVTVTGSARYTSAKFWFRPQKWGYKDYSNMCVEFDVVEIGKLKDGDNPSFNLGQYCTALSGYSGYTLLYEGDHVKVAFSTSSLSDERNSLISFSTNGSTAGINNKLVITNFTMYHIDNLDAVGTYDCCKLATPDDLELYDVYYGNGHRIEKQDKLDLTTGILTRNVVKWKLNDYLSSNLNYWNFREWGKKGETTNEYVRIQLGALSCPKGSPTLCRGWSEVYGLYFDYWETDYGASWLYDGATYFYATSGGVFFMCSKAQILSWTGVESYELLTTQIIHDWFRAGDFTMMNVTSEPTTEQLSLNALKSYRNGSITTSSQQLAPTLKTTLPISNKFTTTNLTSGSTYNVYFDGTATKLDAGATIITNPVSPCEVECGGTTLTIEGADIQNVRVLETSVKNEVGGVCGTTDVELSRIKTKCELYNYFDDIVISQNIATKTEIDYEVSKMIVTPTTNAVAYNISQYITLSGTYKFHCKVKVKSLTDKYKFMFENSNMNTNDVTPTSLVEEINLVSYVNVNTRAYFYALYADNPVEYYDISLIKLSDDDITGTDTSGINYSQVISTLEQPIKLRSLGTTYDSYNPVTGELTKRIGVSETDGSYSVLSSPIVITPKYKMLQDNNIMPDSFPQMMDSAYIDFLPTQLLPNTTYTVFLDATTAVGQLECGLLYNGDWYDGMKKFTVGVQSFVYTTNNQIDRFGGFRIRGWGSIINNLIMVQGEYSLDYYNPITPPQLYTNGQVKVYSDSDVYPTTILNGQSTNNYEVNELNKSNDYTIRYEGECESIILNGKSNEQGTNRIVKTNTNGSGNLTFVNDSGDIDNVLLVQNDVREQEINHFTGLQTVEVSRMLIENQRNMWSQDYIIDTTLTANYKRISKDYIKVVPNETLYCSTGRAWMDYSDIIQYNENKERVTSTQIFGWGTSGMYQDENNIYKNKVQLSEKTHYIRICMHTGMATTASVSRGDFLPPSTLAYNQYQGQYIDLPRPVQLNGLPDGTCDTYNPITGEYVQRVNGKPYTGEENWGRGYYQLNCMSYSLELDKNNPKFSTSSYCTDLKQFNTSAIDDEGYFLLMGANYTPILTIRLKPETLSGISFEEWLVQSGIVIFHAIKPITTQLTPINIPTFESGILQLITTDGKIYPMIEYSLPTNNRYDTSSWEAGAVYTQRNMTEAYFNESTTPMTPTETMTLTTDHISGGSIILNDNGNGLIVLKGNYTGRDIPYFTGMRSVESIEVEVTPSPDQPLFGKGGRK